MGALPGPAEETLEEIVVTGTRRPGRTVVDSPVPIDVLQGKDFRNIGTNDMDDVLRTLIPAYNVRRYPLHDENSLVSASLRARCAALVSMAMSRPGSSTNLSTAK